MLAVVYLVFNEGYVATSGDSLDRVELTAEAIRLGRLLVELMPDEPEAVGLLALMLLTESRRAGPDRATTARSSASPTRTAPCGTRTWWPRARSWCAGCLRRNRPGPYQLQAAIAAVHSDATQR